MRRPSRRGTAIVEFAIVAPVFLTLIVGTIEVGRAIVVVQLLTNASREGARVGGYSTTTSTATVTAAVNSYLANESISGATTTVTPDPPSQAANGSQVSVVVSIPFNNVSWLPSPFFLGGQTLSATSVMCREPAPQ
jgi:Flp pilus assembly protein TadG